MPSPNQAFPFRLQNGEYIIEQTRRYFTKDTKIGDVPSELFEILGKLWAKGTGLRWYKAPLDYCWVYEGKGDQGAKGYPRIHRAAEGHGAKTSLRRYIAEMFFDMDSVEDGPIYVVMKCGNKDCVNPRHMTFADHPNPQLGLED